MLNLNPPLNYVVIKNDNQLDLITDFCNRKAEFGLDLETNVVKKFHERRIRTLTIGDREEQYIVDLLAFDRDKNLMENTGWYKCSPDFNNLVNVLSPILDGNKHLKISHNAEFEYITIKFCLGIRTWNVYDSFNIEKLFYSGKVKFKSKGFWALDDLVKRYLNLELPKDEQKNFDLVSELNDNQKEYAALDARVMMAIKAYQDRTIKQLKLETIASIENQALPAFGDMHLNGVKINVDYWKNLIEETEEQKEKEIKVLDEYFLPVVGHKQLVVHNLESLEKAWRDCKKKEQRALNRKVFQKAKKEMKESEELVYKCSGQSAINYSSSDQLLEALWKLGIPKKKLPSTNDIVLEKVSHIHPVIKAIQNYRATEKLLTTYGHKFLEAIDPVTNRLHSHFIQIGTETGRPSSENKNIFNIPKEQRWRSGFIADHDKMLITADFSGQELRIVAECSQEPILINAFKQGWDVHSYIAEMMFKDEWKNLAQPDCKYYNANKQKCSCIGHTKAFNKGTKDEKPSLRDRIKEINFGIIYGMTENKLSEKLKISKTEARELLHHYYDTLPVLIKYLDGSGERTKLENKSVTPLGRIRYFKPVEYTYATQLVMKDDDSALPSPEKIRRKYMALKAAVGREGRNHVIQGGGGDMLKIAMGSGFDKDGNPFLWHILPKYNAKQINSVYDELLIECPSEHVNELKDIIKERMIAAAGTFVKSIPFDVEYHVEKYWCK